METKTLSTVYYKTMFGRKNVVKEKMLQLFLGLAPSFRMVPEVFLRRNMGRRYFNFSVAMFIAFLLAVIPVIFVTVKTFSPDWSEFFMDNLAYYAFVSAYIFMCFRRKNDIKHKKGVFDFDEYTKSAGLIHPRLLNFKDLETETNYRLIETTIEPLIIFCGGLILLMVSTGLGIFIIFCALVYRLSYAAQYHIGDNLIMDMIDKIAVGKEIEGIILNGHSHLGNRGVRFFGTRPENPKLRQQLWDELTRKNDGDDKDENGSATSVAL